LTCHNFLNILFTYNIGSENGEKGSENGEKSDLGDFVFFIESPTHEEKFFFFK